MKTVRFLVEGEKDVYFFRALFAARFAEFKECGVPEASRCGARFVAGKQSVEVIPVGGYTKLCNVKASAEDKCGDGLRVAVVFDADVTGVERGGVLERTKFINEVIASWKLVAPPEMPINVFLFPDNRQDGELENLLEEIVPQRFAPLIAECWRRYELCLEVHGGEKPSQKSKMNDYEAAVLGPCVWEHHGIMNGLLQSEIWDWNSSAMTPLCDFISNQLFS